MATDTTEAAQVRWAERLDLADKFGSVAEQALTRARSEKSSARAVRDFMEAAAIAIDKALLLAGETTERQERREVSPERARMDLVELLLELEARDREGGENGAPH